MLTKNKVVSTVSILACVIAFFVFSKSFANFKQQDIKISRYKDSLIKENVMLKSRLDLMQEVFDEKVKTISLWDEEKKTFSAKIESLKKENDGILTSFRGQLDTLKKKNAILLRKIADLENSPLLKYIRQSAQFEQDADVKKALDDAADKIEAIQSGVAPASVSPGLSAGANEEMQPTGMYGEKAIFASQEPKPLLQSTVLSVYKKNNIVVIGLGSKDGVNEGTRIKILKKGREIATAEIVGVRYRISAAILDDVRDKYKIDDISKGDVIIISR